jgi:hypothetical protein
MSSQKNVEFSENDYETNGISTGRLTSSLRYLLNPELKTNATAESQRREVGET